MLYFLNKIDVLVLPRLARSSAEEQELKEQVDFEATFQRAQQK